MNKNTVLLIVISMFATACAKSPSVAQLDQKYGCDHQNLNLILAVNKMQLVPKAKKCVRAGTEYTMTITVTGNDLNISAGDVSTEPKLGKPDWLSSDNSPDAGKLKFTVGEDEPENAQYSYFIKVEGVGTLDPIVKVVR
jgi:hypothetical protein